MSDGCDVRLKRSRWGSGLSRRGALIAGSFAVGAVLIAGLLAYGIDANRQAQTAYDSALAVLSSSESSASMTLGQDTHTLNGAVEVLDSSDGKVDEALRTILGTAITDATSQVEDQAHAVTTMRAALQPPRTSTASLFSQGIQLRSDTLVLDSLVTAKTSPTRTVTATLAGPVHAVKAALAHWQAERARILAARYSNNVQATGWYAELDQCSGSVDISAHYDNVPTIAEHWSCGGKLFPDDAGTIITLTGVHEGTYRVEGIVAMLNSRRNTAADLPRGYDLLYQTCQNGQSSTMSFTALTKIVE